MVSRVRHRRRCCLPHHHPLDLNHHLNHITRNDLQEHYSKLLVTRATFINDAEITCPSPDIRDLPIGFPISAEVTVSAAVPRWPSACVTG